MKCTSGPVVTMLKEFLNGVFTLSTLCLEEFKNVTVTGYFVFVFEESFVRKI